MTRAQAIDDDDAPTIAISRDVTRCYRSSAGRFGSPQAAPMLAASPDLGRWDEQALLAVALSGPLDARAAGVLARAYQRLQRELADARSVPVVADEDDEPTVVDVAWRVP